MKTILSLVIISFSTIKVALPSTFSCQQVNNSSFTIAIDGSEGSLYSSDLGTHEVARVLNLPFAGKSYHYTELDTAATDCAVSPQDAKIVQCFKRGATLYFAFPEVELKADLLFYTEKVKGLSPFDQDEYYKLIVVMTFEDTKQVVQEEFIYNAKNCSN